MSHAARRFAFAFFDDDLPMLALADVPVATESRQGTGYRRDRDETIKRPVIRPRRFTISGRTALALGDFAELRYFPAPVVDEPAFPELVEVFDLDFAPDFEPEPVAGKPQRTPAKPKPAPAKAVKSPVNDLVYQQTVDVLLPMFGIQNLAIVEELAAEIVNE